MSTAEVKFSTLKKVTEDANFSLLEKSKPDTHFNNFIILKCIKIEIIPWKDTILRFLWIQFYEKTQKMFFIFDYSKY